jgi:DMSO/TMAO reductase YedYZ heme-binding membrane subunit
VYLAGLLVIVHYIWLVKSDIRIPILYGLVIVILLILRIPSIRRYFGKHSPINTVNRFRKSLRPGYPKETSAPQEP